jgi:hypothetical protein
MRSVSKFRALPPADRWLLAKALLAVTTAGLRLKLLPFRPGAGQAPPRSVAIHAGLSAERIAWAVDRVSDRVGNATCLVRALAAHAMLGRHGFSSCVRIGVVAGERRQKGSDLIAHAWIELGGQVLLGGPDVSRYTPLLTWCH